MALKCEKSMLVRAMVEHEDEREQQQVYAACDG
jgi:hypothetical protein